MARLSNFPLNRLFGQMSHFPGHAVYPSVCYFIFYSSNRLKGRPGAKGKGQTGSFLGLRRKDITD